MAKQKQQKTKDAKPKKPAKANTKAKPPQKTEMPDWLRKAMAIPPKRKGRPPGTKNTRTEPSPQQAKAKRGKNSMANKPLYDPLDDPDMRAGAKGEAPGWESPIKPPNTGLGPDNTLPGGGAGTKPVQPRPGGGTAPDNTLPEPEGPASFDEVASGEIIPAENAQMLIAGTLGGSGDNHASAKRILERFVEAGWELRKALDAGTGDTRKGKSRK